jgi:23S rRNA pseudouridine1911/1915/1917 synthase
MPVDFEEEDYSPSELGNPLTAKPSVGVPTALKVPLALAGKRLDQALAEMLPDYSRSRLAVMIKNGHVLVDGRVIESKVKLLGGESIDATLIPRDEDLAFKPEDIPLNVIHEDEAIIVINKPANLVVHPAAGNWQGTLLNGLLFRNPSVANLPRAGIVHRLDKDTTGVMVAAKTEAAQLNLVRQLQARTMKRVYTALARGFTPEKGAVDAAISRHPRERTKMAVVSDTVRGDATLGKAAVTHFRMLARYSFHTLVECSLETGRTHQIRVHMQSIGFPLEADPVYGPSMNGIEADVRRTFQAFGRQALHARRLTLIHPNTEAVMTFEAPLPDDLRELIEFASTL